MINEYLDDELADDESDARKIKKAASPFPSLPYFRPSSGRYSSRSQDLCFRCGKRDIGPIAAPEAQVLLTQELLENEQYPFEFEEFSHSSFVQGKLRSCIDFWRSINCSDFILDVIDNGYKILFENAPTSFSFKNRGSTKKLNDFVSQSILELLDLGCIKEFSNPPEFCNPLHVAVQSSGKLRLILDLSHLNTMVVKKSFK